MSKIELFGTKSCLFTAEVRGDLEWRKVEFVEYDVEEDSEAFARMLSICPGNRVVPILVEDGKVVMIGWQGRGCVVGELK
ncbi:MAG: hypothetical protein M1157_04755 [Deinococcus sp.]|nr:hypothetical protein [Deinococcus sp.]